MTPFYTAMDAAYDAQPIRTLCHDLGIVSLIDSNPRGQEKIPLDPAKAERYKSRSSVERVNSLLKEGFGGTACPGSGSREGVRASDVWNCGPDGHAASSSQDPPSPSRQRRPNGAIKGRFVFARPPENDLGLKQQENGDRSEK